MKSSILATLAYPDIFDYPLTIQEIWQWLVNKLQISNFKFQIVRKDLENPLNQLVEEKLIGVKNGYYFLWGRTKIVEIRKQREGWSEGKIKRAKIAAQILRFIPWIKLIGLTGALARKNTKKDDDIDLFFITAQNRLWLTRGFVVLILSLLGLYRRPNRIADMICPNMLISEDALEMTPKDLFTAHEICLMKPIFERDDVYQKFLQTNRWVKRFLPNTLESKIFNLKSKIDKNEKKPLKILLFTFYFLDIIERVAQDLQLWYMRKRRTTEIVSDNLIKFHPQDAREWILREYQARLQKLSIIC